MKNKDAIFKGLAVLALVVAVAGVTQETKPRAAVGFSVGVGTPYYGYGYGNCSYVDDAGFVHYYPCGGYGYGPGVGFGLGYWGGGWGGHRHWRGGHRGGWHRGGGRRGGGRRK